MYNIFSNNLKEVFSMNYDFYPSAAAGLGVAAFTFIISLVFAAAIGITFYLLHAFGLYRMAKRLGIPAPGLAFVPIVNVFTLGKIAETPVNDKKTLPYGTLLLIFSIAQNVLAYVCVFRFIGSLVKYSDYYYGGQLYNVTEAEIFALIGEFSLYVMLIALLAILYSVFTYIALYKTYKLFAPDNAALYLVLSILFGIATPIIIFCLRNKTAYTRTVSASDAYNGYNPYGGNGQN